MNNIDALRSDRESILVTRNAAHAAQWEARLAREFLDADLTSWRRRPVRTVATWHDSTRNPLDRNLPGLLSPAQARALWRRIVADSEYAETLIDPSAAASWAYAAWMELNEHAIEPESFARQGSSEELTAFLKWCKRYRQVLNERFWTDQSLSLAERRGAADNASRKVALLDCGALAPAISQRIAYLSDGGWQFTAFELPKIGRRAVKVEMPGAACELEYALAWAASRCLDRTSGRVALVVDDLGSRRGSVDRILTRYPDVPYDFGTGPPLTSIPAVEAALNALELLGPDGNFGALSRWLRSAFFQGPRATDFGAAARLEAALRDTLLNHVRLRPAYEHGGLRQRFFRDAEQCGRRMEAALRLSAEGGRLRSPTTWVRAWRDALDALGWGRGTASIPSGHARAWEDGLEAFASLTPILPSLDPRSAIAELRIVLRGRSLPSRLPVEGIHIFEHIDDIGPGYDAVWCTGFSAERWPRVEAANPLLPRWLRRKHELPWSSPADTLARHRSSTRRLIDCVPEVVFSWTASEGQSPGTPSALLNDCPEIGRSELGPGPEPGLAGFKPDPNRFETLEDTPPAAPSHVLSGGVAALNMQAKCPLRAFLEFRLEARPPEAPRRGIGPRLRGIMAHRAAELLLPAGTSQAELISAPPAELDRRIHSAAEKAVREAFAETYGMLSALAELETERLLGLLRDLLVMELRRTPFRIVETEQNYEINLGLYELTARLDRLDEIGDGELALLDYKSGRRISAGNWFRSPLEDVQVPLYAGQFADRLSAAVLCLLQPAGVRYRGYWVAPGSFPGMVSRLPEDRAWPRQLEVWSSEIARLAADFMQGDGRIRADQIEPAAGLYACLTRVYEALAAGSGEIA